MPLDGTGPLNFFPILPQGSAPSGKFDSTTNAVTTIVSTSGTASYTGDGGLATSAKLSSPAGCILDAQGNLFVADTSNHAIRKVDLKKKVVSTIFGNGKQAVGNR